MIRPLDTTNVAERRRVLELVYQSQYAQHVVHNPRDNVDESRRSARSAWRYNLADSRLTYYVYEHGSKILGYVLIRRNPDNTAFIDDLGVDEDFRRQKIGTALINFTIQWAKEQGMSAMKLTTQRTNVAAAGAYRGAGFKDIDSEYIDFEMKLS